MKIPGNEAEVNNGGDVSRECKNLVSLDTLRPGTGRTRSRDWGAAPTRTRLSRCRGTSINMETVWLRTGACA